MASGGESTAPVSMGAARTVTPGGAPVERPHARVIEGELLSVKSTSPRSHSSTASHPRPPPPTPKFSLLPAARGTTKPRLAAAAYQSNAQPATVRRRLDLLA